MSLNYYVHFDDGTVVQVGGVTDVTIVSPLVGNGTYRDEPPIVAGGASAVATPAVGDPVAISVAGGSSQTVNGSTDYILAPSSVLQSDSFAHVDLRFKFGPIAMIFFTTENGMTPTTTFPMARPVTNFNVVTADCFFMLDDVRGVSNVAPPGFTPATYTPP